MERGTSPEETPQVVMLKAKLRTLGSEIKSIRDQGRLVETDISHLFLFKGMYKSIQSYFDAFNSTWDKLIELSVQGAIATFPAEADKGLHQQTRFYYYEATAIYEFHMNPTPTVPANPMASSGNAPLLNDSRTVRARLPQINLPQFNGTQTDWPLFRDTFQSLIHDEASLSNIEKFHFLLSCLKGPALSIVKNVPLQEANYEQAWRVLNENYNDRRRLATNYLKLVLGYTPFKNKPTASALRHLLTSVVESIQAFKQLQIPNADDFILMYLVLRCLDTATRKDFEKEMFGVEFPSFDRLVDFLKSEWKSLDITLEEGRGPSSKPHVDTTARPSTMSKVLYSENQSQTPISKSQGLSKSKGGSLRFSCPICKAGHSLYHCNKFKLSPASERRSLLKSWSGCINCFSSRHRVESCESERRCEVCKQKHHSWLHVPQIASGTPPEVAVNSSTSLNGTSLSSGVILGTALIDIKDSQGKYQTIRLVTDCGSQHSFISKQCVSKLGLEFTPSAPAIAGLGQVPLPSAFGTLTCSLRPRHKGVEFSTKAIIVSDITAQLPHTKLPEDLIIHLGAYSLADPTFWKPQTVDFLLGADLYFEIVTGAPLEIRPGFPKLLPTKLGYVVAGKCDLPFSELCNTSLFVRNEPEIGQLMSRFWEVEEFPKEVPLSLEEAACETHFKNTHYRLPSGRYAVALPFKPSVNGLKSPRQQVVSRFLNLEFKLSHRPALKAQYYHFMEEYLNLGHMQPALNPSQYLIPHHCVSKMEQGNAKIRVVFDASCRGPNGSLNDHLLVGPKIQRDLSDIVMTFRTYAIVVVADIVKMYRQIVLRPEDRPYQHILWRSDPKDEMVVHQLNTVTYGINSSSWLAIRTLRQLVEDEGYRYPLAARTLSEDSYVDDIVSGASTLEDALILQQELIHLLQLGGFELSKWKSNHSEVLSQVQSNSTETDLSLVGSEDVGCKILGLQWNSSTDTFSFDFQKPKAPSTKRGVLSTIARIYDPLGFLAPVVFKAKVMLQDIWNARCEWDQNIPAEIDNRWSSFSEQLNMLSSVKLTRFIGTSPSATYSLVGFSDASQRGFAAVIYLRVSSVETTHLRLLRAKTKLAPTKPMSIPRLELCGSLLLARLLKSCMEPLSGINIQEIYLYSDSTVVLGWLRLPLNRLKAFVAHRVSKILSATQVEHWHHVATDLNPADCASRGLMPQELINHELWWTGPDWLLKPSTLWPQSSLHDCTPSALPEIKPIDSTVLITCEVPPMQQWMSRCSSYLKIIRTICHVIRFITRLRKQTCEKGELSLQELKDAREVCIKAVQTHYFSNNKQLLKSRYWKSLAPFSDQRGLLRVGGRLRHSNLPFCTKHPIILPDCHFTRLLVDFYHRSYLHIGPTSLGAMLSNRFHICAARRVIRSRVRQCVQCQRARPSKPQAPFMGNLPSCRLEEGQIFQNVGVDLGGPFPLKESNRRKAALGKAYLCLFICLVTRAVHLEIITSCSTEAFLATLHRFISRRGRPRNIFSDCGTNFVGAASELKALYSWYTSGEAQQDICRFAADQEIQWHFNPPQSPHFGGIWEAGIKSAKTLLAKNLRETPLTFEELATIFCRIEAVLNSRPLCPVSTDPDSLECLTPGHFLIGRAITAPPEGSLLGAKENTLRRWQLVQQRVQNVWAKWRTNYLHQLQQRRKWSSQRTNLQVGDLVILNDPACPPTAWPLARVVAVHPGSDGVVRVVTIRTAKGEYKRPVTKLVPLVLPSDDHLQ